MRSHRNPHSSRLLALLAASLFLTAATATATPITFDPAVPLNVVDQGGFTGSYSLPGGDTYKQVRVRFSFPASSLATTGFSITGIGVKGDGISGSLPFPNLTISGTGTVATAFISLPTSVSTLDFHKSLISFQVPGDVINNEALFQVAIQYENPDGFGQINQSFITYSAVPEPSAFALMGAALGMGCLTAARRRRARAASTTNGSPANGTSATMTELMSGS